MKSKKGLSLVDSINKWIYSQAHTFLFFTAGSDLYQGLQPRMAINQGTPQLSKSKQLPKAQFSSSWIVGKKAKISTKANTALQKLCLEGKLALLQVPSATGFKAIPSEGKKKIKIAGSSTTQTDTKALTCAAPPFLEVHYY